MLMQVHGVHYFAVTNSGNVFKVTSLGFESFTFVWNLKPSEFVNRAK